MNLLLSFVKLFPPPLRGKRLSFGKKVPFFPLLRMLFFSLVGMCLLWVLNSSQTVDGVFFPLSLVILLPSSSVSQYLPRVILSLSDLSLSPPPFLFFPSPSAENRIPSPLEHFCSWSVPLPGGAGTDKNPPLFSIGLALPLDYQITPFPSALSVFSVFFFSHEEWFAEDSPAYWPFSFPNIASCWGPPFYYKGPS